MTGGATGPEGATEPSEPTEPTERTESTEPADPESTTDPARTAVVAPVAGRVVGLAGVPDPVFAQAMVGPGTAIDPVRAPSAVVSPVDGEIIKLHPHAFVVAAGAGRGVLVHLGIDTVQLKGEGFDLLAAEGDRVVRGQPLVRWNPAVIESGGRSPVCPVVALDATAGALTGLVETGTVDLGDLLFRWT